MNGRSAGCARLGGVTDERLAERPNCARHPVAAGDHGVECADHPVAVLVIDDERRDQLDGVQGQVYPTNVVAGTAGGRTFADISAGAMLDISKIKIQNFTNNF